MSRRDFILEKVKLKGVGLEIGPLHAPIVGKDESEVYYLDHASQEELKKKYSRVNKRSKDLVELDTIAPVDYVLKGTIARTVGKKKFDYVVASHVIEHIPDTVSWLKDIASVLKPGGILTLAIPDKRFTFDITRNVSRPSDTIGAYFDKLTQAYTATVYDFTTEYRDKIVPKEVWSHPNRDFRKKPRMYTRKDAVKKSLENINPKIYVDIHCNVYTPYSFFEIVKELIELGLFDYEVAYFHDTEPNDLEFHVSLKKSAKSKNQKLQTIPKLKPDPSVKELQTEIEKLRAQIEGYETSKSWKLTKPLREATTKFYNLRKR